MKKRFKCPKCEDDLFHIYRDPSTRALSIECWHGKKCKWNIAVKEDSLRNLV